MADQLILDRNPEIADFAVIGAGNGGVAMAGFLTLRGFAVNLWNRSQPTVETLNAAGGIMLEGEKSEAWRCQHDNFNIGSAAGTRDHGYSFRIGSRDGRALWRRLHDGQIVVLNPGRTGGALAFRKVLRDQGCINDVTVAETNTFIYASRRLEGGRSRVFGVKKTVSVAALPASRTIEVVRALRSAFPQFVPAENVMVTSLDNMGAIFHPVPTLLNAARVDSSLSFEHYTDGISPSVASVLEALDAERLAIARGLGVYARSALDWLRETYGIVADSLYEGIQANKAYHGISAPTTLDTRYIKEDVPFSLVPMLSLANVVGVSAPVMKAAISLASVLTGVDYMEMGRNAFSMGIDGIMGSQLTDLVTLEVLS